MLHLKKYQDRINLFLEKTLPNKNNLLDQAIRYSVLNGGKRLRPILVYLTGEMLGTPLDHLDNAAFAIELIHCYSLVHDDLPAMDNDDFRRGKLTCHKQFNEATAILVGDALQMLAFEKLFDPSMCQTLARAAYQMVEGQMLDIHQKNPTAEQFLEIYRLKTGALIDASVKLGARAANCQDEKILHILEKYAQNLGLAFQIQDDLLDLAQGEQKITFASLAGFEKAKQKMQAFYQEALRSLKQLPFNYSMLESFTQQLLNRDR